MSKEFHVFVHFEAHVLESVVTSYGLETNLLVSVGGVAIFRGWLREVEMHDFTHYGKLPRR